MEAPDDRTQLVGVVGNDPARQLSARQLALIAQAFLDGWFHGPTVGARPWAALS